MATTVEIDRVLFKHPATRDWYGGTWALDEAVEQLKQHVWANNLGGAMW